MKRRFHFSVRHAMIVLLRTRWMSTAGEQCRKPQREKRTLCLEGHALLSHLDVNLLDYVPHKATAVPLFLALCVSHGICCPSHESVLAPLCRCPQRAPAPPRIL